MNVRTTDLVALVHLGCARNLIDSELILGRMADEGLVVTGDPSEAYTVVLNTCSFIGPAREESHEAIADLVARKKAGELGAVVVAGCLVQRYKRGLARQYPEVDVLAVEEAVQRLECSLLCILRDELRLLQQNSRLSLLYLYEHNLDLRSQ